MSIPAIGYSAYLPRTDTAFRPETPPDLAVPSASSTTTRAIHSMALRRLFDDLRSLRIDGLPKDLAHDYRRFRETLVTFLPGNPNAIATLLRSPTIAAPLRCLRDNKGDRNKSAAELITQGFYQLERRDALPAPVELRAAADWRISSLDGCAKGPGGMLIQFPTIIASKRRSTYLALRDNNPIHHFQDHPDQGGTALDLGGQSAEAWVKSLKEALDLLDLFPGIKRDAALLIRQFVPVGFHADRHLSATYREAIGTIYLSLHPDPMTMVEAVVREVSHTKLNALLELDDVLLNAPDETYSSPVRPDPKPVFGILFAVHGSVPIAHLYTRLHETNHRLSRTPHFTSRWREIVEGNTEGFGALQQCGRPTNIGEGLFLELREWTTRQLRTSYDL